MIVLLFLVTIVDCFDPTRGLEKDFLENENARNLESFRLPDGIIPEKYEIDLKAFLDPNDQGDSYSGEEPQARTLKLSSVHPKIFPSFKIL